VEGLSRPGSLEHLLTRPSPAPGEASGAEERAPGPGASAPSGRPGAAPQNVQFVVLYRARPGGTAGSAAPEALNPTALADGLGIVYRTTFDLPSVGLAVSIFSARDDTDVADVLSRLSSDPRIVAADTNRSFKGLSTEGVDLRVRELQYALKEINAVGVSEIATGRHVRVALIDSGVDARHAALAGRILAQVDLVGTAQSEDAGERIEETRHGTGIAGVIAAQGSMVGLAPEAGLISIRAFSALRPLDEDTESTSDKIVRGIDIALRLKARVINMSFGGPRDRVIERMTHEAALRGVVLVAAAGNGDGDDAAYPAAYPDVIAVAATDNRSRLYRHGRGEPDMSLAAPGVDIVTTGPNGGYQVLTGSSIAAAHVSGLAVLVIELAPTLGPADVRAIMWRTGRSPAASPGDGPAVPRLIDARAALASVNAQAVAHAGSVRAAQ
ncbi:MAG TPA: S8 family serine peptidase, partial [Alphaproteobacteria bacterium]|nr:S8 family serine peptidase [Alphaproteobacteria bacterium]